jgi:hypothetical protein
MSGGDGEAESSKQPAIKRATEFRELGVKCAFAIHRGPGDRAGAGSSVGPAH